MLLRVLKARLVVLPLAVMFLLFSAGIAAAPDCHIGSTAPTTNQSAAPHSHGGIPHDHSKHAASAAVSGSQVINLSTSNAINYEICFVVGFIVLLSFRFLRAKKSLFTIKQLSLPKLLLPQLLSKNLGYLNVTHLKLGIIRI
jgi:hypothetical protein